jgi:hypothetical protein
MDFAVRSRILAGVAGLALGLWAAPANAAWEYYISHPLGFSVAMPGEIAATRGTYEAEVAGRHNALVFSSSERGIDYRVTVVDMRDVQNNASNLLGEAGYNFQSTGRSIMDIHARADRHFGRKHTIDLPNDGGRQIAQYYFLNGQLLEFKVSIPAGGDYASPDVARFIDSVAFYPDMANQDSVELALPD